MSVHASIDQILTEFECSDIPKSELALIEIDILCGLEGYAGTPTIFTFLTRFVRAGFFSVLMVQTACFIAEKCLLSADLLKFLPSHLAAACVYIVRKTYAATADTHDGNLFSSPVSLQQPWTSTLVHYTGYSLQDVLVCVSDIRQALHPLNERVELQYIKTCMTVVDEKYSTKRRDVNAQLRELVF